MKYLRLFETHSAYSTYINGQDAILPNVSYCEDNNEVHYNPWTDPRLIVTFNVADASGPTMIYGGKNYEDISVLDYYTKIEVDGVEISLTDLDRNYGRYQLSEGEHTIRYTLSNPLIIGYASFIYCSGLTSFTIPNSVTSIDSDAFKGCSNLTSITIPNSVTTIGSEAFYECTGLTSITMPDSITYIGNHAFGGCTSLTNVTISNNVTSIGIYAFGGCSGLTSITIPDSVTTIGRIAFSNCTSLTSVTIGSGVTSIGDSAFIDCTGLTSITSLATTAPTISNSTFQNVKTGGTLTVPSGSTGYDTWMGTGNYYLGLYNWTKVEQ